MPYYLPSSSSSSSYELTPAPEKTECQCFSWTKVEAISRRIWQVANKRKLFKCPLEFTHEVSHSSGRFPQKSNLSCGWSGKTVKPPEKKGEKTTHKVANLGHLLDSVSPI